MDREILHAALRRVVHNDQTVPLSMHEALRQLDQAAASRRLPGGGDLRHYLQKRSYQKALATLEAESN